MSLFCVCLQLFRNVELLQFIQIERKMLIDIIEEFFCSEGITFCTLFTALVQLVRILRAMI